MIWALDCISFSFSSNFLAFKLTKKGIKNNKLITIYSESRSWISNLKDKLYGV
jgi:hypothetical protein